MKIEALKKSYLNEDNYKRLNYIILNTSYCCEKIKVSGVIKIVNDRHHYWTNREGLYVELQFEKYDWRFKCTELEHEEISYCPFCSKKINIEIKEIDITKEVNTYKKEIKELNQKIDLSDSVKEIELLRNEIYEIENKLRKFQSEI